MAASPTPAATDRQPSTLPPGIGVLIYDGDCGFCSTCANWYSSRAGDPRSIVPWQRLELAEVGLTEAQVESAAWWRGPDRSLCSGADAFAAALSSVDGAWSWAGRLLGLPGAIHLARVAYPVIARNRHRLPGSTDACRL